MKHASPSAPAFAAPCGLLALEILPQMRALSGRRRWRYANVLALAAMGPDFDRVIDRRQSDSNKWHKFPPDVLPLWVADMDFSSPPVVVDALKRRVEHGFFGYLAEHTELP